MPRPKKPGSAEPKTRSRHGCWPCKHRKIKCGEEKPGCLNCERNADKCDYSIILNWQGRSRKDGVPGNMLGTSSFSTIQHSPTTKTKVLKQEGEKQPEGTMGSMTVGSHVLVNPNQIPGETLNMYTEASIEALASPPFGHTPPNSAGYPPPREFDRSLNRIRAQNAESYPSPAESNVESPPGSSFLNVHNKRLYHTTSSEPMPPPISNTSSQLLPSLQSLAGHSRQQSLEDQRPKRMRFSPAREAFDASQAHQQSYLANTYFTAPNYTSRPTVQGLGLSNSYSPLHGGQRIPPTPGASSGSEDNHQTYAKPSPPYTGSPGNRRVSIQSLVSGTSPESPEERGFQCRLNDFNNRSSEKQMYGFDHGLPDLDIPKNKDDDVLSPYTPKTTAASPNSFSSPGMPFNLDHYPSEFGFLLDLPTEDQQLTQQEVKSYYSRIVKVEISTSLGALPPELQYNQMNLLYFHHFVDHTARILVPYDCSENPFKILLPKMALQDPTLLHLLLAYSAKHRSRLLKHPEPAKRIAGWMQDVFPALIAALDRPPDEISDSNLATAIMLASLEIISPAPESDEIKVSWQRHLDVARQMMVARSQSSLIPRDGEVNHFLTRWFAYLDVLGSLSGGRNLPLFHGKYFHDDTEDDIKDHQIDCLMGFTSRCVSILARVAELAHICDNQRIDPHGNVRPDWQPSSETISQAEEIKMDLYKARQHVQRGCHHRRNSTDLDPSYAVELVTTNDAFHWAGLIQLHRRVLGKPTADPEVQFYVGKIVAALGKIRPGGTAEACLLFPMFTAGCDALPADRGPITARLRSVEKSGMFQVRQAIGLVEKVWESGRSWESFLGEVEFIG